MLDRRSMGPASRTGSDETPYGDWDPSPYVAGLRAAGARCQSCFPVQSHPSGFGSGCILGGSIPQAICFTRLSSLPTRNQVPPKRMHDALVNSASAASGRIWSHLPAFLRRPHTVHRGHDGQADHSHDEWRCTVELLHGRPLTLGCVRARCEASTLARPHRPRRPEHQARAEQVATIRVTLPAEAVMGPHERTGGG